MLTKFSYFYEKSNQKLKLKIIKLINKSKFLSCKLKNSDFIKKNYNIKD